MSNRGDELRRKLRIGCSGWGYEDWVGPFYPPKTASSDFLRQYSKTFDVVEVDSSFYRPPSPATTAQWYRSTPPGFLFAAKLPKRITHDKKLAGVSEELGRYYHSIGELKEKAGPIVIQLPPSVKYDKHLEVVKAFLEELDSKFAHTIEFRHASWFRDDVYRLLEQKQVAMTWSENQYLRTPTEVTSDFLYLRMVGDRELTKFNKIQKEKSNEMKVWYKELGDASDSVKDAFVFFNNHYAGFGPGSVNEFRRLAGLMEFTWPSAAGGQKNLADFG